MTMEYQYEDVFHKLLDLRKRYELILWYMHFLKLIPGKIGILLRNILIPYKQGVNVNVFEFVQIDMPSKLSIGNNVYINRGCILNAGGETQIGDNVGIGPNVIIYSQNHNYWQDNSYFTNFKENGYIRKKVKIGNNVWIGAASIILPGVYVGDNAIIAAGTIVTKNIDSNVMVGGNPAGVIKKK